MADQDNSFVMKNPIRWPRWSWGCLKYKMYILLYPVWFYFTLYGKGRAIFAN